MSPLITCILPTFRRPERLKQAIQSVLDQTYPHFQICVYDNNSGDATASVVAEFAKKDPRVKYQCHEKNIGSLQNFQHGLKQVETPFFSFLSDDDLLLPEFYETAMQGFEKYPDAGISMGTVIEMEESGDIINIPLLSWQDQEYFPPPSGLIEMIGKYSNWTGSLFRAEVIEKIGFLDLNVKAIDVDFTFRTAAQFSIAISKKPYAIFTHHASCSSRLYGYNLINPGWSIMIHKFQVSDLAPDLKTQVADLLKADMQNLLFACATRSIRYKQFERALATAILLNSKKKKFLLKATSRLCSALHPAHTLFVGLFTFRNFWKRRVKQHALQKKYGYLTHAR